MGKFVNPFTDIGFKIIFGQPASKPFLITLLNELLAVSIGLRICVSRQGGSCGACT